MTRPEASRGGSAPFIAFLALFLFAGGAAASPAPVTVEIGVVAASSMGSSVDPSLSSLRTKLQSMFNYSSYKLLNRMRRTLAIGETGDFNLPGNRTMRVTPVNAPVNKVRFAVQIMEGGGTLLATTLGLSRGGMVLVAGPPYQSGVLILLISAE